LLLAEPPTNKVPRKVATEPIAKRTRKKPPTEDIQPRRGRRAMPDTSSGAWPTWRTCHQHKTRATMTTKEVAMVAHEVE